jgi:hypothetical protein
MGNPQAAHFRSAQSDRIRSTISHSDHPCRLAGGLAGGIASNSYVLCVFGCV